MVLPISAGQSLGILLLSVSLCPGEPEVRDEHPVLENNRDPGGREDGQTSAAEEHPNRGYSSNTMTLTGQTCCRVLSGVL